MAAAYTLQFRDLCMEATDGVCPCSLSPTYRSTVVRQKEHSLALDSGRPEIDSCLPAVNLGRVIEPLSDSVSSSAKWDGTVCLVGCAPWHNGCT